VLVDDEEVAPQPSQDEAQVELAQHAQAAEVRLGEGARQLLLCGRKGRWGMQLCETGAWFQIACMDESGTCTRTVVDRQCGQQAIPHDAHPYAIIQ
jgi:hypothetical protein